MTNLDGLCQGGLEGENYPKTTRTGKATKKSNKKEVWKSLVRASSSAQPTEEKTEETWQQKQRKILCMFVCAWPSELVSLSVCRQFVCMWSVRRPLTVVVFDCIALVSFSVVLTRPLTSGVGRGQGTVVLGRRAKGDAKSVTQTIILKLFHNY